MDIKTAEFIENVRKMRFLQEHPSPETAKDLYFSKEKVDNFLGETITFQDPMKCRKCKQNTEGV